MTRGLALPLAALLLLSSCAACRASDEPTAAPPYPAPTVEREGETIAKVGDVVLTTRELEKRIREQAPLTRAQLAQPAERRRFVENEIRYEVLAQEGWRRGLYADPRVQAALRRAIVERVMREEMEQAGAEIRILEEDLRAAYEARSAEYNKPEKVRVSAVTLHASTPATRKIARAKLEARRRDIEAAERRGQATAFADAARMISEDLATRGSGGDLDMLTREALGQRVGADVAARAFDEMEVGAIQVAETDDAVILLKKTGKRHGSTRTFEMVKPQLKNQLMAEQRQKRLEARVAALAEKAGIRVDDAALARIEVAGASPTAAAELKAQGEPTVNPSPDEGESEGASK